MASGFFPDTLGGAWQVLLLAGVVAGVVYAVWRRSGAAALLAGGLLAVALIPSFVWPLGVVLALIGPLVLLVVALARRNRSAWVDLATSLLLLPACLLALGVKERSLRWGLGRAARGMRPVVAAIERHRQEKGAYPGTLDDLVPRYLPARPRSGFRDFPRIEYRTAVKGVRTYELRVPCSRLLQWDSFVYWPEGDYPRLLYGGGVTERVEGWAYVSE
jgi:hypothetical protein